MTTTQSDRAGIALLVDRLLPALDERGFTPGWAGDYPTADARTETPLGAFQGADALRVTERALGRYDRTQHLAPGVLVAPGAGADEATASWNALMTHVHGPATRREYGAGADPLFVVGGRLDADLVRTTGGWRSSRLAVRAVWTRGLPPPGVVAETGSPSGAPEGFSNGAAG